MDNKNFKDLFSTQANQYLHFRPLYPNELYAYLSSLSSEHDLVWDCGTGNGQAAFELAKSFKKVIATDPSEKQIKAAKNAPNITYEVGTAETFHQKHPELKNKINLITVAQAFHWFNHSEFGETVSYVLSPGGHLAIWTYALASCTPEVDCVIEQLYQKRLNGFWEKERKMVDEGYRNIYLPFKECTTPSFEMSEEWTLNHLVGYLSTWSAVQTYIKKKNQNPIEDIYPELLKAWGNEKTHTIKWPLSLRIFKK